MNFTGQIFAKTKINDYIILIPKTESPTIKQAVKELVLYAEKCAGILLKTEDNYRQGNRYISIGFTKLWERTHFMKHPIAYVNDGFSIKTIGEDIVFDANTERGFLYATYEFIERVFNVKFLAPEETVAKRIQKIELPVFDIKCEPVFPLRTFLNYPTYPIGKDELYTSHSRTLHNWFVLSEEFGGAPPVYSRAIRTHNARFFVPAEKYGTRESTGYTGEFVKDHDPHPEFYYTKSFDGTESEPNWRKGTRGPTIDWTNGITEDGKLDENMPISVAKIVIEEMKKDVLANPSAEYFQLDQEDFIDFTYRKDLVEKYGNAGILIRFCNVVATELQKWADEQLNGRKIKIVTFAYQQTMHAPVRQRKDGTYEPLDSTVVPVDNLYIRLAYMSFNYFPYNDYRQPKEVLSIAKEWSSICKHFWFWGYDSMFNDYIVYNPTFGQIKGTIQQMKELGVEYFIMLSSYNEPNDWQAKMKEYVWSKMFWNENGDVQALIDEYLEGYYREGATYVREMMALLDKRYAEIVSALEPGHDEYNCYREIGLPKNINGKLLEDAIDIIENGEKIIKKSEDLTDEDKKIILLRLELVKFTPMWMRLKFYKEFYPNASVDSEMAYAEEILKIGKRQEILHVGEGKYFLEYMQEKYNLKI